jgi:hypothetical protein
LFQRIYKEPINHLLQNEEQNLSGDRNMTLTVDRKGDFAAQKVSEVIRGTLEQNLRMAKYKIKKYLEICEAFEKKYGMNSDLFMEKFDSGELGDNDDFFD